MRREVARRLDFPLVPLVLNQTREFVVRIPFALSLFGLLLLGTNGYADDIDVHVDIVVPDGVVVPDGIVVQMELIQNDHYAVVQDQSGEIIWRQLIDLPERLQGDALVDLNIELAKALVVDDGCSVTIRDEGDYWLIIITTEYYDSSGEVQTRTTEIRIPKTVLLPPFPVD